MRISSDPTMFRSVRAKNSLKCCAAIYAITNCRFVPRQIIFRAAQGRATKLTLGCSRVSIANYPATQAQFQAKDNSVLQRLTVTRVHSLHTAAVVGGHAVHFDRIAKIQIGNEADINRHDRFSRLSVTDSPCSAQENPQRAEVSSWRRLTFCAVITTPASAAGGSSRSVR
jgi:hypothetical protein